MLLKYPPSCFRRMCSITPFILCMPFSSFFGHPYFLFNSVGECFPEHLDKETELSRDPPCKDSNARIPTVPLMPLFLQFKYGSHFFREATNETDQVSEL